MFYLKTESFDSKRYDNAKFMEFVQQGLWKKQGETQIYDKHTSWFLTNLVKLPKAGEYTIREPRRPDVYSNDIYSTTDNWELLLVYNGISRIKQLTMGRKLFYPSISEVESLYFTLTAKAKGNNLY